MPNRHSTGERITARLARAARHGHHDERDRDKHHRRAEIRLLEDQQRGDRAHDQGRRISANPCLCSLRDASTLASSRMVVNFANSRFESGEQPIFTRNWLRGEMAESGRNTAGADDAKNIKTQAYRMTIGNRRQDTDGARQTSTACAWDSGFAKSAYLLAHRGPSQHRHRRQPGSTPDPASENRCHTNSSSLTRPRYTSDFLPGASYSPPCPLFSTNTVDISGFSYGP